MKRNTELWDVELRLRDGREAKANGLTEAQVWRLVSRINRRWFRPRWLAISDPNKRYLMIRVTEITDVMARPSGTSDNASPLVA